MASQQIRYPFSAVVGQDELRLALILTAISPRIGGVVIRGEKGTAKTTTVRAFAGLLGDAPLVNLPLGSTEDRVVGSLNMETVLTTGRAEYQPGLLAQADGGVLYVDEVNLLADHLVDALLDAAASGRVSIERRYCLGGLYMSADIFLDALFEEIHVIPSYGETACEGVSAEVYQQVPAALYGAVDVETGNRACGAHGIVAVACEHHCGTEIHIGEPGSHNAYHAFLPVLVIDHYALAVLLLVEALNDDVGLLCHLLVYISAQVVILVNLLCSGDSSVGVVLHKQLH